MNKNYFSLGPSENALIVRIIRIMFGMVCIAIAIFWMIFNIRSVKADRTLWVTVLFLAGFGLYQIWAGTGRAARFIEIDQDKIILRKNSFLPTRSMPSDILQKIELYPLNVIFYFNSGKKTILRFGTTFTDIIDPIKTAIENFAADNHINLETISEEI
jgi:hypothetical protein